MRGAAPQASTTAHWPGLGWAGWAGLGWAGWAGWAGLGDQLRQNRLCHHAPAARQCSARQCQAQLGGPCLQPATSNPGIKKQILDDTLIHTLMHHKHCIETSLHVCAMYYGLFKPSVPGYLWDYLASILPVQYPPRLILVLTTDYSDELCEM